jgi:AIPR protein
MDLLEFRDYLLSEVDVWAAADHDFRHSSFVNVVAERMADAGEVSDFEACYYRGIGARRRAVEIDGFAFDDVDGSARLFLADPSLAPTMPSLGRTEAETLFKRLRAFVEEALDGSIQAERDVSFPETSLAGELRRRREALTKIRAYVVTDKKLTTRARDWPEGDVSGIPVEYHIWDIDRLYNAHVSLAGRDDIEIDFSGLPDGGIPCIEAGSVENELDSYLCVIPGSVLGSLYVEHGSRLLEGNVRSFLTIKRKVNKEIRNTILYRPRMFFSYNNGIGATAEEATIETVGTGGLRLVRVKDLQIVNGGQTTVSLASAKNEKASSLDGIFVTMKLTVVRPDKAAEMIPDISRYANSQNPVSEADFFSNHPYHRRLEEISRRIMAPPRSGTQHDTHWFYERARGQYMNATFAATAAERRRFQEMNPKDQVLTKTDLAKSENAWRELPQVVSRGAQKNFRAFADYISEEWKTRPDDFNEDYFRAAVGRVILFRSLQGIVTAQPWYSGGYRANVVTYAMSMLARIIREQAHAHTLDSIAIWSKGAVSPALSEQLVIVAKAMHDVITDPPPGTQNVTEWAKRDLCWEKASAVQVSLSVALRAELVSKTEQQQLTRAARAQQRMDSGIGAQEALIALGQAYWARSRTWARERGFLSAEDDHLLALAADLAPRVPSERESKRLLELKERYELEGMPPEDFETEATS